MKHVICLLILATCLCGCNPNKVRDNMYYCEWCYEACATWTLVFENNTCTMTVNTILGEDTQSGTYTIEGENGEIVWDDQPSQTFIISEDGSQLELDGLLLFDKIE